MSTNLDSSTVTRGSYTSFYYNNTTRVGSYGGGIVNRLYERVSRVGTVTANYKKLADVKRLPPNTFAFNKYRRMSATGNVVITEDGSNNYTQYSGIVGGVAISDPEVNQPGVSASVKSGLDASARTTILNNIKNQKVNLAQVFAERKMTLDLINDTIFRLANGMTNLRKGNFRAAADGLGVKVSRRSLVRFNGGFRKNQSKAIANGWLELQYGWKPLLQDVYGSAEAVANAVADTGPPVARVSCTKQASRFEVNVVKTNQDLDRTDSISSEYTTKYVVNFQIGNELLKAGSALGLTNPAMIAWELLPYSFVVDWFLPIGNWINSLDATNGCTFVSGSVTRFERTSLLQSWSGSVKRSYDRKSGSAMATQNWVVCTRDKLSSFPVTGMPQFKNPLSLTHAANGLALLTQLFKK